MHDSGKAYLYSDEGSAGSATATKLMGAVLPGQLSGVISRGWKDSALALIYDVFEPCNCIDGKSFSIN